MNSSRALTQVAWGLDPVSSPGTKRCWGQRAEHTALAMYLSIGARMKANVICHMDICGKWEGIECPESKFLPTLLPWVRFPSQTTLLTRRIGAVSAFL